MRMSALLASACLLASCGGAGGGVSSLGSVATGGTGTGTGTPSPTPTPTATSVPIGSTGPAPAPTPTVLFDVATTTSYTAIGSLQSLSIDANGAQRYAGNASTVATPSGKISYNPRDGIFTLELADDAAGVNRNVRFQDPAHRTDHDGLYVPRPEIIALPGFNYLEAADGNGLSTFFYQRPGTGTSYVTLGGFVHITENDAQLYERGVFAFGTPTASSAVPRTGTGRYAGDFLATMVGTDFDALRNPTSRLQWIAGTSTVDVDFSKSSLALAVTGTVSPAFADGAPVPTAGLVIPAGAIFTANGTATLTNGAFAGHMAAAQFASGTRSIAVDFAAVSPGSSTAGASSIDGTFFGPNGVEVGGNFRVIGGIPDQRVDIHGAFTGKK